MSSVVILVFCLRALSTLQCGDGAQAEHSYLTEFGGQRLECRAANMKGVCRAAYWREESCTEKGLQKSS